MSEPLFNVGDQFRLPSGLVGVVVHVITDYGDPIYNLHVEGDEAGAHIEESTLLDSDAEVMTVAAGWQPIRTVAQVARAVDTFAQMLKGQS
jgi:hypothetical protein